jgi:LCP family protein required for cell wall assembly
MANGRPPDDGSSRSSRRKRDKNAPLGGLEALGKQMGETGAPGSGSGPGSRPDTGSGPVANQSGLQALGARVDESGGRRSGGGRHGRAKGRWGTRRKILVVLSCLVVLALVAVGGSYLYLQRSIDSINHLHVSDEVAVENGAPFTVLVIGSDTRVGQNSADFGSSALVTGQRSDVVQLWRITPSKKLIQVISIPRDTVVAMIGSDAEKFGQFNRINSAFDSGTDQLVKTITANFGIPINHVAEIDFSGFEDAVNSVGGVYLDFNYPAKDAYSDLDITTPGCQLLDGAQALSVARSRHYEYYQDGEWQYDGTSDFGRIQRQDAFLRSLIAAVKSKETNPIALAKFAGSLHEGLEIDDGFSASELIGLAETYRSFDGSELNAQTLPTENSSAFPDLGDVLVPDQPAAQQALVNIFGSSLVTPTQPPPNVDGVAEAPPTVTPTTASPSSSGTTTPTTTPPPSFDPTPCTPS